MNEEQFKEFIGFDSLTKDEVFKALERASALLALSTYGVHYREHVPQLTLSGESMDDLQRTVISNLSEKFTLDRLREWRLEIAKKAITK